MAEAAIDVIDIGPYLAGDPAGTRRVVGAVSVACERIGFLVIEGHGVPDALVRRVFDVLLCHGRSGLENSGAAAVADPRIQALARRVAVAEDPDFTRAFPGRQPTEVTVELADGTQMSEHADFHPGEAEHPHPHDAVRRKFLDLTVPVWGPGKAEALYDRVLDLERVPDVAALAGEMEL